jgi:hypothetical protein
MLFVALIGWVFFRADNLTMAAGVLQRMFAGAAGSGVPQAGLALTALSVAGAWGMFGPNIYDLDYSPKWWKPVAVASAFGVALALIAGDRTSPFLYFQF